MNKLRNFSKKSVYSGNIQKSFWVFKEGEKSQLSINRAAMEEKSEKREEQTGKVSSFLYAKKWLAPLLVALLTFLVFLPALSNDFINLDDDKFVYENQHITSIDGDFFTWAFTNREMQWSPLRFFSHAIDYTIWELNPMGHHLTNIILHSLNTFLVVLLVFQLCQIMKSKTVPSPTVEDDMRFQRKALITGVVTGLLFGLHPLHVESVAWVSERKDVLYTFFYLLSLMVYLKYASPLYKTKKKYYYFLCLLCFTMALMSKALAVTLPLVLIILDVYPLERLRFPFPLWAQRNVLLEKLPFLGLSIAVSLINVGVHEEMGALTSFSKTPLTDRILVLFKSFSYYLMKMVWPSHLASLNPYPHTETISFFRPDYAGGFILLLAITAICIFLWRKGYKIWLVVWAYFLITLLPVLGIIKIGGYFAAERYTYMPSIGPFLLAGLGISLLWEKTYTRDRLFFLNRKIIILALVLILSGMSVLTIKQIKVWRNSITLWTSVLKIYPDYAYGYISRAKAYKTLGKYDEVLRNLNSAVNADTEDPIPYNHRGWFYEETAGDYHLALGDFSKAIELDPELAGSYSNRARLYMKIGEYQKAFEDMDKAIALEPTDSAYYLNRCEAKRLLAGYQEAIEDCSKALEIDPDYEAAYHSRGLSFYALGKYTEAISNYDTSLAINPDNPEGFFHRGLAYKDKGKHQEAIGDFSEAIALRPNFADSYINRGVVYGELGNLDKAIEDFTKAIKIDPKDATAYYNRGSAYYRMGKEKDALRDLQKAARLGDKTIQEILKSRGISW